MFKVANRHSKKKECSSGMGVRVGMGRSGQLPFPMALMANA